MSQATSSSRQISAIVPARNEEAVIAACVASLAVQPEIAEILVIDDQSSDRTTEIVRALSAKYSNIRLLQATELPPGWVGKNNAVWIGAREARSDWLLFTDADAVHAKNSVATAYSIAEENGAALVSFSPEQLMDTWYEKAVIPYVFTRLGSRFRFADVNSPQNSAAAANGQFILIRRDAYESVGGHASIAGDVLEDVALARRVKAAGYRIWFGSGKGIVRVRMYRTFAAMWDGWKKNLYSLMGGSAQAVRTELVRALLPVLLAILPVVIFGGITGSVLLAASSLFLGLGGIRIVYGEELESSGFSPRLWAYGIPGRILFAAMIWASYRDHRSGRLEWKGRTYPAGTPRASKRVEAHMVYLTRKLEFSASHLYHNPALSAEENRRIFGKCNNPHGHGHNYTLEVTVAGEPDPVTGMVLDLKELKEILEREITQRMDHRFLNYEVAELKGQIPTCENIVRVIWNLLEPKINKGRLHKVRLYETPDLYADCYRNGVHSA